MIQQPLTSAGVQDKIDELYALTDPLLNDEADAIQSDFRGWIQDNFTLSSSQINYLSGIDERWIELTADETAWTIKNRGAIVFDYDPLDPEPPSASKIIRTTNSIVVEYSPNGGFSMSGELAFEIYYP